MRCTRSGLGSGDQDAIRNLVRIIDARQPCASVMAPAALEVAPWVRRPRPLDPGSGSCPSDPCSRRASPSSMRRQAFGGGTAAGSGGGRDPDVPAVRYPSRPRWGQNGRDLRPCPHRGRGSFARNTASGPGDNRRTRRTVDDTTVLVGAYVLWRGPAGSTSPPRGRFIAHAKRPPTRCSRAGGRSSGPSVALQPPRPVTLPDGAVCGPHCSS